MIVRAFLGPDTRGRCSPAIRAGLSSLAGVLFVVSVAAADVPDPEHCIVSPWDTMGQVLVSPGQHPLDQVTVTVRNAVGNAVPGATVQIILCQSDRICYDPFEPGLGPTNANGAGVAQLNPQVGGCDECSIQVRANGVLIRTYTRIVSPDWDGSAADGIVDEADEAYFSHACDYGYDPCADLNHNGLCDGADLSMFASAYGNRNPNGCIRNPSGAFDMVNPIGRLVLSIPSPNPVRGALHYALGIPGEMLPVRVRVFDSTGRLVASLLDRELRGGTHAYSWKPLGEDGRPLASGIYYLRLESSGDHASRMFVLVRD